ncbi:hypothetical protein F5Y12DRAFT_138681 [Xylaria sp. FL1777]|nr:hypothetical protein F5Y12DRAFT_138681 [Xylaria sp. FL1777]
MASTQHLPPAYTSSPNKSSGTPERTLHKYKSTFVLAFFFLILLVVPWVFLSVLNIRPIGGKYQVGSWQDVSGRIGDDAVQTSEQLYRAFGVLSTVTAVLTFPVLSSLLSHAAVVVVQRRHPDQHLNAYQMLSLADAPWSRLPSRITTGGLGSNYAYGAIALVALGFLQLVLQSALVTSEEIRVATYYDAPYGDWPSGHSHDLRYSILGYDATPERMAQVPIALVTKEVTARMSTDSSQGAQPRRWYDGKAPFASAFPSGVNTGVLRYHAMRLNTSVQCEAVSRDKFPDTCPGAMPFYGNLSLPSTQDQNNPAFGTPDILLRWCVPGNFSSSPWSINRDRQDITEEMFVDFFLPEESVSWQSFSDSFTTHCSASTTRGYFELPNYQNNFTHGPLLENWTPSKGREAVTDDVDTPSYYPQYLSWAYSSNYPYENYHEVTPGPLTTAMLSMFGNESWILPLQNISVTTDPSTMIAIYRDMCTGGIPFLSWGGESSTFNEGFSSYESYCTIDQNVFHGPLLSIKGEVYGWFSYFGKTSSVNQTLASAAFLANEATLTRAGLPPGYGTSLDPGVIYTSPGATVHKPSISLPAEIVISILIGVEALAIVLLLVYIYRKPTFTTRLDSFVVATIGAQLSATGVELPHLHETGEKRYQHLQEHDGVIGLSHGSLTEEESHRATDQAETNQNNDIELAAIDEPQPSKILIIGGIGTL